MLTDLKRGIDSCLQNARRMIDDARLLQTNGKFMSAIPLYVLAYEEMGKTMFLSDKYIAKHKIHEKEWKKLTASPYAHLKKVIIHYERAIQSLARQSPQKFEKLKTDAIKNNFTYFHPNVTLRQAIFQSRRGLEAARQLPIVKLACLYVDYKEEKWLTLGAYNKTMLDDLC